MEGGCSHSPFSVQLLATSCRQQMDVKVGKHLNVVYSIEAGKALCLFILILSIHWSHFESGILTGLNSSTSIVLWSNPKALFVCIRSHTTIIELSICVLSIFCFPFQLHLYLSLDAGEGDDHHGLSSGPRESICYPTSWCWGQGAVHISYLKPFAINKMFPAFSIVFSGLPVRRQHRGG